jgi:hypothetical protein
MRDRRRASLVVALGAILVAALSLACGAGAQQQPLTDFSSLLPSAPTLPPAPTLALDGSPLNVPGPPFAVPEVPDDRLKPIVGPAPDWWYLVPIHPAATASQTEGRSYHYVAPVSPQQMTAFYLQALQRGGWEPFLDPIESGSYSLLEYSRGSTDATIYISPRDAGSLVSILIQ